MFDSKAQPHYQNDTTAEYLDHSYRSNRSTVNQEAQATIDDLNEKIQNLEELLNTKDTELTELRRNVEKLTRNNDDLKRRLFETENDSEEVTKVSERMFCFLIPFCMVFGYCFFFMFDVALNNI